MLPKVLLVDDMDFFLEMEKDFLGNAPVQILTARNGQQAFEIALRERPAIIFMDVTMPVMDGLSCCRLLKNDPRLRDIPVVMMLAESKDITAETCRQAGCDGVLSKPVDRAAFFRMGRTFLKQVDRRNLRVPCRTQVTIRHNHREIEAASEDLSETGMYLCCPDDIPLHDMLWVDIHFPDGTRSGKIMARVAWLNRGASRNSSMPKGLGIKFSQPSPASKEILQNMVRKLALGLDSRHPV
jgi:CheY-like chemotaxis protein